MITALKQASDCQDWLIVLIEGADIQSSDASSYGDEPTIADVNSWETFEDAAILSRDAGLIIRTAAGAEFQITILQTKSGRE